MVYLPRYGPEWGSGVIFNLKYYSGVLYFILIFEADRDVVAILNIEQRALTQMGGALISYRSTDVSPNRCGNQ